MRSMIKLAIISFTTLGVAAPTLAQQPVKETVPQEVKEDHAKVAAEGKANHQKRLAANRAKTAKHRKLTAAEEKQDRAEASAKADTREDARKGDKPGDPR